MKTCSICGSVKPTAEFNKSASSRDGFKARCRQCQSDDNAKRYAIKGDHIRATVQAYAKANATEVREKKLARYQRNRDIVLAQQKLYVEANREAVTLRRRAYRLANPSKERAWSRNYRKANMHKGRARTMLRFARKRQATPAWSNRERMAAYYKSADALCMLTGDWYHVDHIVPLRSDIVCGLHNEFNLQILPALDNLKKSNLFWSDKP